MCGLLAGIGIGIGFGALIFHPFNSNSIGGGIWLGKKRRKRYTKANYIENEDLATNEQNSLILTRIDEASKLYDNK